MTSSAKPTISRRGARAALRNAGATAAAMVSPRHRRWKQLLASCDLDPAHLPQPIAPPGPRDFIICGAPRSGTALATAALFLPPAIVTVMEPWDGLRLPPAELFHSLRDEVATGVLRRGRLDVGALERDASVTWCRDGEISTPLRVDPDHLLGVKWPSFWRYIEYLPDTKFVVCVRDPSEVVASYATKGGRLGEGLEYDVAFNRQMNTALLAEPDTAQRRVALYDYVYERILPALSRPNVFQLRYEHWFEDRDALIAELGGFLGVELDPDRVVVRSPAHHNARGLPRVASATAADLGYS